MVKQKGDSCDKNEQNVNESEHFKNHAKLNKLERE